MCNEYCYFDEIEKMIEIDGIVVVETVNFMR